MTDRSEIQITPTPLDYAAEALGWLICAVSFGMVVYYMPELPDQIPTHYGLSGRPDSYGAKSALWTLPIVATVLYAGCMFLVRRPRWLNYGVTITPENAARQYANGSKMIRSLGVFVAGIFGYLVLQTVRTARGSADGLGWIGVAAILFGTLLIVGYYFRNSYRAA